jgi:hypothetical protein
MSAEMAARRTAAAAVAADFHTAMVAFQRSGPMPDYQLWAHRLETELRSLLAQLEDEKPHPATEPAKLAAIRAVLGQVLNDEFADRQYALERIEQIAGTSRTASGPELGGGAYVSAADLGGVLAGIADAASYLEYVPECEDCDASPSDLCEPHAAELDTAAAYRALWARLGGMP